MKLYIYEHCPFCTRARMIFGLKQIPVELSVVMEGDANTPIRLVGRKTVPILQKDDGTHMAESLDIVRYVDGLADPILTAPADEALDAWGKAAWPSGLKLFIPRFTKGEFKEISTPEAREAYRTREEKAFGDLEQLFAQTPVLAGDMNDRLNILADLLVVPRALGPSDVLLYPILRSLSIVKALSFPPPVHDYAKRIERASGVPLLFSQAI